MSCYLIKVTEQYRCDTEAEAEVLINEAKESGQYTVVKSSSEIKTTKAKGEVVDEWRRVLITKEFTSEKEPTEQITVTYGEDE
jgi:hypothetical protein